MNNAEWFLLVGGLLPRPNAEYSLLDVVDSVGSQKRKASSMAMKGDSPTCGFGDKRSSGWPTKRIKGTLKCGSGSIVAASRAATSSN